MPKNTRLQSNLAYLLLLLMSKDSFIACSNRHESKYMSLQLLTYVMCFKVPSSPPTSVASSVLSSSTVQISWSPPDPTGQNGIITSYTVIVSNTAMSETITYTASASTTFLLVSGLSAFTTHECYIAANTSVGRGPFTTKIVFKTPEDGTWLYHLLLLHHEILMM